MKERPILFSGEMVRAILDGRKTQTRRVFKNPDWYGCPTGDCTHDKQSECDAFLESICPYGVAGDRLWVRETWAAPTCYDDEKPRDLPDTLAECDEIIYRERSPGYRVKELGSFWRSPYHMPRWASRITLEITKVRVERLQDITLGDVMAEGCPHSGATNPTYRETWYRDLWDKINGKGAWDKNPWVWVIEFKRV